MIPKEFADSLTKVHDGCNKLLESIDRLCTRAETAEAKLASAVAEEREACAKIADSHNERTTQIAEDSRYVESRLVFEGQATLARIIAADIRRRGEE